MMVGLGYESNGYDHARGFQYFHWLNLVTAHIPGLAVREHCSKELLLKSDAEAKQAAEKYCEGVDAACRALLVGFGENA